jgi:hypothetical protein
MKIILIILCLLLSGCATKIDNREELLMEQIKHNMQSMNKIRQQQMAWEDAELSRCLEDEDCRERRANDTREQNKTDNY